MMQCEHCSERHDEALRYCPNTGKIISPERFFPVGTILDGKYRLGAPLGAGAMGAVFAATHTMLDKAVAVKLMLPDFSGDREMAARMVREARIASATAHRNVALVTDMGWTPSGSLYLVMELLEGQTLSAIIRDEAPLPVPRAMQLTSQILDGLEAVHRRDVVHRDLKPDNVMVVADEDGGELIKILDFGVSKVLGEKVPLHLTSTGAVMGTPYFMAPEQARGLSDLDHRADLYAVGAMLYNLLTGTRPIAATSYNALIASILEEQFDPPSQRLPTLTPEIDAVVMRALCGRDARFPDARSFRAALEPFIKPSVAPPPPAAQPKLTSESISLAVADDQTPDESPELELDLAVVADQQRQQRRQSTVASVVRPAGARRKRTNLGLVLLLIGMLLGVGLVLRHRLRSWWTGVSSSGQSVLVLVETRPRTADVYVDGVRALTKPIELPRVQREFTIRVQARGYVSKELRVRPDRTRTVQVSLRRKTR